MRFLTLSMVRSKLMAQYEVVGKSLPRLDSLEKAVGAGVFALDMTLPRMLHGKILRSTMPHGRVVRIDVSKVGKIPGVRAVVTADDTAKIALGATRQDEYILAVDKVRYVGEEVAAVAAESEEAAEEALQAIVVECDELPGCFDPVEALQPGAVKIHAGGNLADQYCYERGNVEEGFKASDLVFENRYQTAMSHHGYLEPRGCLASADPSGKVTIWGGYSGVFRIRLAVSRGLGLKENQVRVIQTLSGGSFGGKGSSSKAAIAALLALKTGRPVRLVNSRSDDLLAGRPRSAAILEQKVGVKKDGRLLARQLKIVLDCGAYLGIAAQDTRNMATRPEGFYRFSHLKAEGFTVYTNKTPTGPCRGFGAPQGSLALETQLDEVAEALGMDPMELRLKNIVKSGDKTIHGWNITSCGLPECLQKVTEAAGWKEKRADKKPGRGLGLACNLHNSGGRRNSPFDGSGALVKVEADGSVILVTGEGDTGQGAWSTLSQMVAEDLGIPYSSVQVTRPDTETAPYCLGSFASRLTVLGGGAVRAAAEDARDQLIEVTAGLLEANPRDLVCRQGNIFVKGVPEKSISFAQAARAAVNRIGGGPVIGRGVYDPPTEMQDPDTLYGNYALNYPFCAQVAEVEVDEETGQVKLISLISADDLGKAINPLSADGQIEGCVVHGIGFALIEELVWQHGNLISGTLMDYRQPTARDINQLKSILVEPDDPVGPFGAKGVAESSIASVAAAIANAIYDAVGVRIRSAPITAEKVLQALKEKKEPKLDGKIPLGKTL